MGSPRLAQLRSTDEGAVYLRRLTVQGFRAAAAGPVVCDLPGRFSLLLGANGAGKTTISEAIYQAHLHRFPRLAAPDAAALGAPPRAVAVEYEMETDPAAEGALGLALRRMGAGAPRWTRSLERSLGRVRAGEISSATDGYDRIRMIYLPALRNPVDELSRRETRVLLELLRAEQLRQPGKGSLAKVRAQAEHMLSSLTTQQLVMDVQGRIANNLKTITGGVREHFAFIGTQSIDDAYLARVLELLLATLPDPLQAVRLEAASLGYVNLLHIAVTLAGVPDPVSSPPATPATSPPAGGAGGPRANPPEGNGGPVAPGSASESAEDADNARRLLQEATEAADADQDSFFPEVFHATVVIEEPEAHLHPQLQYGLVRYLRHTANERPDLQVIVSTHAGELVAACQPEDLVVIRRDPAGAHISRCVAQLPLAPGQKATVMRMTRLHLDASRSGALFADRVALVEGITEAVLLRVLGRAWAAGDDQKVAFVDALAVVPIGNRIGSWPVQLLATTGFELVSQVAVLGDTDLRGDPLPEASPPTWHADFDEATVRFFWSRPTLEPSLVEGNEGHVATALTEAGLTAGESLTPEAVDALFQTSVGRPKKAEFALALAADLAASDVAVAVPVDIAGLFDWLYLGLTAPVISRTAHDFVAGNPADESISNEDPDGTDASD